MLRRQERFHRQVLQVLDGMLLSNCLALAHYLRFWFFPRLPWLDLGPVGPFDNYLSLILLLLFVGPFVLSSQGIYRMVSDRPWWQPMFEAAKAIVILWVALLAVIVLFRIPQAEMSRGALLLFLPVGTIGIILRVLVYRWWMIHHSRSKVHRFHVMVCGDPVAQERWRNLLAKSPRQDLVIKDSLDLRAHTLHEFVRRLHLESIDIVIVEFDDAIVDEQNQAIQACEIEGVEAWVTLDHVRTVLSRPFLDDLLGRGLLVYRTTPDVSWQLLGKSLIDLVGSALLIVLLSPVFLTVSLLIAVQCGRPIIFTQRRSGRHGRPFTLYKFRTMVSNAEQRRQELQAFNQMKGPVFKMHRDPRVTPLGTWLRRLSLDELPQLWNVLRGEMSLVGPRPLPVYETDGLMEFSQRRRLSVKPGLTGLWQIAGRNEITEFDNWVRMDLEYIDRWSLWLDFVILFRTIPCVLTGRGAR